MVPRKNGYLILGFQGVGDRKKTDIRLIAIDNWGKVLWDKVYGHDGFDFATSALATEDGGAIIVGATDSAGTGKRDFLLFKIDRNGGFAPWARLGPQAKPKPAKKKKVKPAPEQKKLVKAKPPTKPAPKAKPGDQDGGDDAEAPKKQAKAEPSEKPEPKAKDEDGGDDAPAAKKAATDDAVPAAPPADESGDPPSTSFGEIFGSVFGGDKSDDQRNSEKSKSSEKADE